MEYFEMPSGDIMSISALRSAGIDDEKIMQMISISLKENRKRKSETIQIDTLDRFALRYKMSMYMSGETLGQYDYMTKEELDYYIKNILNDEFFIKNLKKINLGKFDKEKLYNEIEDIYTVHNVVLDLHFINFINDWNEEVDLRNILMKIDKVELKYNYEDEDIYEMYVDKAKKMIQKDKYSIFRKYKWTDEYMDNHRLIKLYEMNA